MSKFKQLVQQRGRACALLALGGVGGLLLASTVIGPVAGASPPHTQIVTTTDQDFDLHACGAAPCPSHHTVAVTCPTGTTLLSGGVTNVGENGPSFGNGGDVEVHQSYPVINSFGQTWAVDLTSVRGATHVDATAYAICSNQ